MVGLGYCLLFFCSFVFLCVTSSVSLTGFYTEDELIFISQDVIGDDGVDVLVEK